VKYRRTLCLLLILLILVLLTPLIVFRIEASPLYVAEEKFAKIEMGMSRAEVREIMGSDGIGWLSENLQTRVVFYPVLDKANGVLVEYEDRSVGDLGPRKPNLRVIGKRKNWDFNWMERIVEYLLH
jgi:hypothetical protein